MPPIRYIIDLEPERVPEVGVILNNLGVDFDAAYNIIAMPQDNVQEGIFMGRDGEWLQEEMNAFLERVGMPTVRQPFHEMSLTARADFLWLATLHCDWEHRLTTSLNEVNRAELDKFLADHPEAAG